MPRHGVLATPPPSGGSSSTSTIQAAILYLRRGLLTDGTYDEVDEWETVGHQWRLLEAWAVEANRILTLKSEPLEGGREHDVAFEARMQRWFKLTKPGAAGYCVQVMDGQLWMLPATPLQYLVRWQLANRLLIDDVEFVGINGQEHRRRIVISQRHRKGEIPTWDELEQAMIKDYGLRRLPADDALGGYEARAYFRGRFGVFDVRPANCVRASGGEVIPFDVIPQVFSARDAAALREMASGHPPE